MPFPWILRKRITAQGSNAGAPQQNGAFPSGPTSVASSVQNAQANIQASFPQAFPNGQIPVGDGAGSPYHHHEGEIFLPGGEGFVFEYPWEFPLYSDWGGGGASQGWMISKPQYFNPRQPPQIYSNPLVNVEGIGGLQAGGLVGQPLLDTEGGNGG